MAFTIVRIVRAYVSGGAEMWNPYVEDFEDLHRVVIVGSRNGCKISLVHV